MIGSRITFSIALFVHAAAVQGAQPPLVPAVQRCAAMTDGAQRLQCYDNEVAPLAGKVIAVDVTKGTASITAAAPATAPAIAEERFGRANLDARQRAQNATEQGLETDEISRRVVALRALADGALRLELEGGQVWRQTTAEYFLLKTGDLVTISKAAFGSFLLASPGGRTTRVRRIR